MVPTEARRARDNRHAFGAEVALSEHSEPVFKEMVARRCRTAANHFRPAIHRLLLVSPCHGNWTEHAQSFTVAPRLQAADQFNGLPTTYAIR